MTPAPTSEAESCFSDAGYVELLEKLRQDKPPEDWTAGAKMGWRAAQRKNIRRLERLYGPR